MKISEMLELLGELQGKYGDVEVMIADVERDEHPVDMARDKATDIAIWPLAATLAPERAKCVIIYNY